MRYSLLAIALVACGSAHPADHSTSTSTKQMLTQTQPPIDGAPPPACPASYGAGSGACGVEQSCSYPEGTCACSTESRCSGRVLSPKEQAEWDRHLVWECTPRPPVVRPDGCPGSEPGTHQACTKAGKICEYPGCISSTFTCTDGLWVDKRGEPPP